MKDRIKQVREQNKLSLTKFADSLGLSVSAVSLYEAGKREPTNAVLNLISQKYGISYAWLKTGEGPMDDPMPDDSSLDRLTETYRSLPDRLRNLVDALTRMDPEWYKTLDAALEEIERRKKERDIS